MTAKKDTAQNQGEADTTAAKEAAVSAAETEAEERQPTQRESVMDGIVAARRDMLRADGVEIPADDAQAGDDTAAAEDAAAGSDSAAGGDTAAGSDSADGAGADTAAAEPGVDEGAGADTAAGTTGAERIFTVKINGEEKQVPESELIAGYQISSAARAKLEEAKRILRDAKDVTAKPAAMTDEGADDTQPGTAAAAAGGPNWKGLAEKLQYAPPDEAAKALEEMLGPHLKGGAANQPNLDEIVEHVERRVTEQQQWTEALKTFNGEFPDIVSNPRISTFASLIAKQTLARHIENFKNDGTKIPPFVDIFREAGDQVRSDLGLKTADPGAGDSGRDTSANGAGAGVKVDVSGDRAARKRTIPQPPAAISARSQGPAKKTDAPPDQAARASTAIAEMRKGRGQAA